MFDVVRTAFNYETELLFYSFLQDFSKRKGSGLQSICNAHTTFLLVLWGRIDVMPLHILKFGIVVSSQEQTHKTK